MNRSYISSPPSALMACSGTALDFYDSKLNFMQYLRDEVFCRVNFYERHEAVMLRS
jgi:hypothetical protein